MIVQIVCVVVAATTMCFMVEGNGSVTVGTDDFIITVHGSSMSSAQIPQDHPDQKLPDLPDAPVADLPPRVLLPYDAKPVAKLNPLRGRIAAPHFVPSMARTG